MILSRYNCSQPGVSEFQLLTPPSICFPVDEDLHPQILGKEMQTKEENMRFREFGGRGTSPSLKILSGRKSHLWVQSRESSWCLRSWGGVRAGEIVIWDPCPQSNPRSSSQKRLRGISISTVTLVVVRLRSQLPRPSPPSPPAPHPDCAPAGKYFQARPLKTQPLGLTNKEHHPLFSF